MRWTCLLALPLLLPAADALPYANPASVVATLPKDCPLKELSGLTWGRNNADILWGHNDSGDKPRIFALRPDGTIVAEVAITGASAFDWEDIASFTHDGKNYLLIGDIGDNVSIRRNCMLYAVEEPQLDQSLPGTQQLNAPVAWSLPVRYDDGPRDCESLAVDGDQVLLLSKRTEPPVLYTRSLLPDPAITTDLDAKAVPTATRLAPAVGLPVETDQKKQWIWQPSAMDLEADHSALLVLTYQGVFRWTKSPGQSWAQAISQSPQNISIPTMKQAEGLCCSPDGIYISGEKLPVPILHILK